MVEVPPPPVVSPDGRFYWDGEAWLPMPSGSLQAGDLTASRATPELPAALASPTALVVSLEGLGDHTTISAAIAAAEPSSRIIVRPGTYEEGITITKPVEIVGEGSLDVIVIEAAHGPCIHMQADHALVRGLQLRVRPNPEGETVTGVVDAARGHLTIEACDIMSHSGPCVAVHGLGAAVSLRDCRIHDSKDLGISVRESGRAAIERCEVSSNARSGVLIENSSEATLHDCRIYDGQKGGVFVRGHCRATIERCDVSGNADVGIFVDSESQVTINDCRIHGGKHTGVRMDGTGTGSITDCLIYGNAYSGIWIDKGPATVVNCDIHGNGSYGVTLLAGTAEVQKVIRDCRIHDGKSSGVGIYGLATLENCEIYRNAWNGVVVSGGWAEGILQGCRVHDEWQAGILVHNDATGTLERCDIYSNSWSGVEIGNGAEAKLRTCRIYDGRQAGIIFHDNGKGIVENCEINGNASSGVDIRTGSDPILRDCHIHSGKTGGVLVHEGGRGTIERCYIHGNALPGVEISTDSNLKVVDCRIDQKPQQTNALPDTPPSAASLYVEAEELGMQFAASFLFNLVGQRTADKCRFVARVDSPEGSRIVAESSFIKRGIDPIELLSELNRREAQDALDKLHEQLLRAGWSRVADGPHWYSRRYQRQ
jgi:F-box protein 11